MFDIIIPVYNALPYLKKCLESIFSDSSDSSDSLGLVANIVIIDDASTDPEVDKYLQTLSHPKITHLKNITNKGFVKTANIGLQFSDVNDVILLNSDTILPNTSPPVWQLLRDCLYSEPEIGLCSPLSNNATILSIPCTLEDFPNQAKICVANFNPSSPYPEIPVGVGFCLAIKREVIQKVGLFDQLFGKGYGEECDYCLRALQAGYKTVCATTCFVYHYGSASFGNNTAILLKEQNSLKLLEKWPNYNTIIKDFLKENTLLPLFKKLRTKKRVLQVIHDYTTIAGTQVHTRQMITHNKDKFDFTVITPKDPLPNFAEFDIVHFQHLLGHNLDLPRLAKEAGCKVVFSLHDYYLMCSDCFLLTPPKKEEMKKRANSILKYADEIIAPSNSVSNKFFVDADIDNITVLSHGVDLKFIPRNYTQQGIKQTLRVCFIGNFCKIKGADLFLDLARCYRGPSRYKFYILGNVDNQYDQKIEAAGITRLGAYDQETIQFCLEEYVDIAVICPIVPETFCLTLAEVQAAGIPCIATSMGAISERIVRGETGYLVQSKMQSIFDCLEMITIEDLQRINDNLGKIKVKTTSDNAQEYREIYEQLL